MFYGFSSEVLENVNISSNISDEGKIDLKILSIANNQLKIKNSFQF